MQKILVIDDSKMIRMRVKDMLPGGNLEVIEARDGQDGIEKIHSEKPQLIILDFLLPKKSGWEVYQEIQNDSSLTATPLVLMSGRKEEVTEKISEPFEYFAFVEKPFERDQLVKAIKDARNKASKRKAATVPPATESTQGGDDVATLKAEVDQLNQKVQKMQGQIDQLHKQMNQLVSFVKKKMS